MPIPRTDYNNMEIWKFSKFTIYSCYRCLIFNLMEVIFKDERLDELETSTPGSMGNIKQALLRHSEDVCNKSELL